MKIESVCAPVGAVRGVRTLFCSVLEFGPRSRHPPRATSSERLRPHSFLPRNCTILRTARRTHTTDHERTRDHIYANALRTLDTGQSSDSHITPLHPASLVLYRPVTYLRIVTLHSVISADASGATGEGVSQPHKCKQAQALSQSTPPGQATWALAFPVWSSGHGFCSDRIYHRIFPAAIRPQLSSASQSRSTSVSVLPS